VCKLHLEGLSRQKRICWKDSFRPHLHRHFAVVAGFLHDDGCDRNEYGRFHHDYYGSDQPHWEASS